MLDLTTYEVGNALTRGQVPASADHIALVLDTPLDTCPIVVPGARDRAEAARPAARHGLTFYGASYAAVAGLRGTGLPTHDTALIRAGLGQTPARLLQRHAAGS